MDNFALSTCVPARLMAQPLSGVSPLGNFCLEPSMRHELTAQAAYFRAKCLGLEPGHEQEDWHAAEAEVDMALQIGGTGHDDS